jgi:uncharacterized protein GlcG (DUF336 family)
MSLLAKRTVLTLAAAKQVAAAAAAEAAKQGWNVVIAVVDEGAHLLYLERMDNVQIASVEVAIEKARCSISFRRPTKAFGDVINGGGMNRLTMPGVAAVDGGVPLAVGEGADAVFVGAIGVSGVKPEQDAQVAQAGADAAKLLS